MFRASGMQTNAEFLHVDRGVLWEGLHNLLVSLVLAMLHLYKNEINYYNRKLKTYTYRNRFNISCSLNPVK